jgi:HSP20 family protein
MTLVATSPWRLIQQWQNELEHAQRRSAAVAKRGTEAANWTPAVDIVEEADRYLLHADISGVKPQEIEIKTEKGVLSIKGERRRESGEEQKRYQRVERSFGAFHRHFTLPEDADTGKISAAGRDGVLEVIIPKAETQQPRKIEVQG